jgi:hypothetical protein
MKRIILAIAATLSLAAGEPNKSNAFGFQYDAAEDRFETICLDGVEYWVRAAGNGSYLATRIDPETLQPRRCKQLSP